MTPSTPQAPCLISEFAQTTELVVPILARDRYERSLTVAQALADRWRLPLRLIHVRLPNDPVDNDRLELVRAAHQDRYPETDTTSTMVAGDTVAEVVASVVPDTALIVMSSDQAARSGSTSIAEDILRTSGGPALIVGPNVNTDDIFGPVLVALDGSPTAERAIDASVALAESLGQPVELVQVVPQATSDHVKRLRDEGQRVSESGYLQSAADQLNADGHPTSWELVHAEDAVDGLLGALERQGGGIMALGTHGDTGLQRRMLGSTAMGLVAASDHPVFVVTTGGRSEPQIAR